MMVVRDFANEIARHLAAIGLAQDGKRIDE